jgi:hypothetical protein
MNQPTYQELILEGIRDLPPEALIEIVDFIYFVRKRPRRLLKRATRGCYRQSCAH